MSIPVFRFFFSGGMFKDFRGSDDVKRVLAENRFALFGFIRYEFFYETGDCITMACPSRA